MSSSKTRLLSHVFRESAMAWYDLKSIPQLEYLVNVGVDKKESFGCLITVGGDWPPQWWSAVEKLVYWLFWEISDSGSLREVQSDGARGGKGTITVAIASSKLTNELIGWT